MFFRFAERCVDAPFGSGRAFQHGTHGRAALAHRLNEVPHAARAVGVLVAVSRLIARSGDDFHTGPVGFHFVGNDHWQAGGNTGAHFSAMRHNRDVAILVYGDEDFRIVDGLVRHAIAAGTVRLEGFARRRGRDVNCQNEARRCQQAAQNCAAADVFDDGV